jgi:release factor H-coupled RctB family protein
MPSASEWIIFLFLPFASSAGTASVTVFASSSSWIESDAVEQCRQVGTLDGVIHVTGMPDLYPSKGAPIGAVVLTIVRYPHLVGSDIGCGIAVFPVQLRRIDRERLDRRFPDLDRGPAADDPAWDIVDRDVIGDDVEGFGTLGSGNHFVELARVDTVLDADAAGARGVAVGDVVLIVHSGSRGLGERILRAHIDAHRYGPTPDDAGYLAAHDHAVRCATQNRRMLAVRTADALGARLDDPQVDVCHNGVEVVDGRYLHRKGAAPGDGRDVLVAGSRGTPSYLVAGHAGADADFSVAHGAGRKLSRGDALRRGQAKHTVQELRRTPLGSLVVCGDRQLLFEEAPNAYKRIDQVIGDLVAHALATPIATTVPVVTYKSPDRGARR